MKGWRLSDVPMIIKIGFAPAIALLMFAVVVTGSIMSQSNESRELKQVVQSDMPTSMRMQEVSRRIAAAHGQLFVLLTHQAGSIDKDKIDSQMKALLAEFDSITTEVKGIRAQEPAAQRPIFDKLISSLNDTRSAVDVVGGMIGVDFSTAVGFVAPFEDSYNQMTGTLNQAVSVAEAQTNQRANATLTAAQTAIMITILAGAATLAIVGLMATMSVLTTRRSISQIAKATELLAAGHGASVDLAKLERKDELGAVVRSLVVFKDNQAHLDQLRADQEAAQAMTEEERRAKAEAAAKAAREQALVVSSLAEGLEHLADGDMTYRVVAEFPGEYRKLRDDFNDAIDQARRRPWPHRQRHRRHPDRLQGNQPRRRRSVAPHRATGRRPRTDRRGPGRDHRHRPPHRRGGQSRPRSGLHRQGRRHQVRRGRPRRPSRR